MPALLSHSHRHKIQRSYLLQHIVALCLLVGWCAAHAVRSQTRDYDRLPSAAVAAVAALSDPATFLDTHNPKSLLSQILIPRPPDTDNSRKVREAILDVFRKQLGAIDSSAFSSMDWKTKGKLGWHLEQHTFTADTPEGKKKMTNLILTKNPAAPRKLVVAAHYDSKYFAASSGMAGFVGATDSAAPCAMMVDLAVALDDALDARERKIHAQEQSEPSIAQETTLQLVFFDGEEAYRVWTHQDSIYGSKALAKQWTSTFWDATQYDASRTSHAPKLTARRYRSTYRPIEHMNTVEHMILLDLLGAVNPNVPSYYDSTKWLHTAMTDAEARLKDAKVLWPAGDSAHASARSFFSPNRPWGGIEDDHLPFLHAGVPILHVIPSPFPSVWHKLSDDVTALDYATMHAWCMILRLTVAEYLDLDIASAAQRRQAGPNGELSVRDADQRKVELVSLARP
ncbi:related to Glutaminyl-peptide cyclotransferase precursor [Sporisorium reilianum SRZ2]|uniref:Peptide hydrolase n=1 Tax=Sporisorium reilianum (strain SRZ2) TaxID=999809 RepID=E6ZK29_SPORE|nr:related to Glutaminyl-peptide cyclotransferase precursor [Sporisorium reilianum SRZ2]